MHGIVLAASSYEDVGVFKMALSEIIDEAVTFTSSTQELKQLVSQTPPALVVLSDTLDGMADFSLARDILKRNAFVAIAVISDLPESLFHERTEGLGIAMQLPPAPGKAEAQKLKDRFEMLKAM